MTTELGCRAKYSFPHRYKGYRLVRQCGLYYGIPEFLQPDADDRVFKDTEHPQVVSASTVKKLKALIDRDDAAALRAERLGPFDGYDLIQFRGTVYGVPLSAGLVDLNLAEDRWRCGVIAGGTREEVED